MIQRETLEWTDGTISMRGTLLRDDDLQGPAPGILIAPAYAGTGPVEEERAEFLARAGYVVLLGDYYGEGKRAADAEEATALMFGVEGQRPVLAKRMTAALAALAAQDCVDETRLGAMGYCYGGKAVLDLARSGADLAVAGSLHGVLDPPPQPTQAIKASVLVMHGWDDPLAKPEAVVALAQELTAAGAEWQLLGFGQTGHSFTNPRANSPESGMAHSAAATQRAYAALDRLFAEKLGR
ncbi:MAG: dienelactone hydrolase family protein [Proteobacteria bacterium]|nr:dienelactone hydrolase family protein [Pseudomonadota bacterium]